MQEFITMKKAIILLMAGMLWLVSCKDEPVEASNVPSFDALKTTNLLGQWQFRSYTDGKPFKYDVSMEIKIEDGKPTINGRSSVNFYFIEPEIDESKKTIKIPAVGSTKIAGTMDATSFEMTYYERLKRVERYDFVDKNTLVIYLSSPANEALYFDKK